MAILRKIFGAIHPTMTFIILVINVSLFLGVLSLVNYVQKNADKWINTVEKKVNDKIDEIKEEIPVIIKESMGFNYNNILD
jgi:predicted PurR-regulated permease PerM